MEKPKGKKTIPRRAMTEQERKLFKDAIEKHHMGAFFGIMYACDLRPQEARALSIFNVNFKNRTIKITNAVEAGTEKEVKSPKTDDGYRTIIVPDWYIPLLKRAYDKAAEMGSPYLFPNTKGGIIGHKTLYRTWSSLMREMDLLAGAKTYRNKIIVHAIAQDLTPYNLRHTCCTEFAENGVDLKMAQYLMGHSDISITAKIYTHVTDKMMETARQKINNGS
ncbi:MAG: site-specific integrase [Clostridiales bacterium]